MCIRDRLITARLVDGILAYSGDGGLGKAMAACGEAMIEVPVNDPGSLRDADTPEDYKALLGMYEKR